MKKFILLLAVAASISIKAQDTFSILAFDSITREVGAAGASCVNLFPFPQYSNHFICELFPDTGAIASQAAYIPQNQANARARMRAGDDPNQILSWLASNDASHAQRQYGVVKMGASPQTAAFTGSNCMNYKNHIVGPNYTIHGNILLGQQVLDSMEARFLREKGDLACKLMAAMQGANMVGADTRCASNNSSSLFAFLKVSLPTDTFGKPSFLVSLKTQNGAQIEPIDSLQKLFSAVKSCFAITTGLKKNPLSNKLSLFPNPAIKNVVVKIEGSLEVKELSVRDCFGRVLYRSKITDTLSIELDNWAVGMYFLEITDGRSVLRQKLIVE